MLRSLGLPELLVFFAVAVVFLWPSWGFFFKKRSSAEICAEVLFRELVATERESAQPKMFHLPEAVWAAFGANMRVYHQAVVLMSLVSQSQSEPEYESVLKAYESLIFPTAPTSDGMAMLEAMRHAMSRVAKLVHAGSERKALSWSMDWFEGVGHKETNPVTLALFAKYWLSTYQMVSDSVRDVLRIC